jgi:heme exporter protein B
MGDILCTIKRDLLLALRRRADVLTVFFFFLVAASLFPLGVGPEMALLRSMGAGVIWVSALLAALLSLNRLFAADYADGTLEQMALSPRPLALLALGKALAHWIATGLPLTLIAPLIGVQYALPGESITVLMIALLLGTPVLSLIGGIGAALTLGLRGGGALLALLVLPLYIPVLVFGAGAVEAVSGGLSPEAHFSILGALLVMALALAPLATAAALRIALE